MAAVDYFLKIDGIQGESLDATHKGEIQLESFSWGETSVGVHVAGGGAVAGKTDLADLQVVMRLSKASPLLFLAGASGQHLKEATLTGRKAGKTPVDFLVIKMTDILISSYHMSGSGSSGEVPIDQVSFNFGRIEVEYKPQNADGSPAAAGVKTGWDVKANKKV